MNFVSFICTIILYFLIFSTALNSTFSLYPVESILQLYLYLYVRDAQEAHVIILQGYDQNYRNVLFSVLTVSEEKWTYCLFREESVKFHSDKKQ